MDNIFYYYYNTLNIQQRKCYQDIIEGYNWLSTDIKLRIDESQLKKIILLVRADHPELFWVELQYRYIIYETYLVLKPQYNCDLKEKIRREKQIENSVRKLLFELSHETYEYNRIKKIFEYLADTVDYQVNAPENQNIYSALVNKRSVCAGYSRAMQYLLQKSGLTALYVPGKVKGRGYHAWNIVRCNGDFCHVDVTFGDPNFTNYSAIDQKTCIPHELKYNYAYLCCNDETIYRDRIADPDLYLPACPKDNFNYFRMLGNYFTQYSAAVTRQMEKSLFNGERYWQCQFSDKMSYEQMKHNLQNGLYANMILNRTHCSGRIQTHYLYQPEVYVVKMWY